MELSEFLGQLEPLIIAMEAKIKTDNWLHQGKRYRKVTVIWCSENGERPTPVVLQVVSKG